MEHTGFEPVALTMRMLRAPNCANAPRFFGIDIRFDVHQSTDGTIVAHSNKDFNSFFYIYCKKCGALGAVQK